MSKAKKLDLSLPLEHHQLLYSILLEVGLPSNRDAWARVISRLPPRADGKATIAQGVSQRYTNLRRKWDQAQVFGENHDAMVKESSKPRKIASLPGGKRAVWREEEEDERDQTVEDAGKGNAKDKGKEEVEVDESSESSGAERMSNSEHTDHEEDTSVAGTSGKRRREADDLDEPSVKKLKLEKNNVSFQVPEDDDGSPCWSEAEVETEV